MVNYQQAKIYKLTSPHTDLFYIGSTCATLTKRKSKHKGRFRERQKDEKAFCPISRKLFELGIDDVKINLVKEYCLENKEQLLKKEAKYIRKYKEKYGDKCLNISIPLRTRKEYREENKEKINQTKRKYYEENKEKVNKQKREKKICVCGAECAQRNFSRHKKSKKHLDFIAKKSKD
jgi:hypothetical protein